MFTASSSRPWRHERHAFPGAGAGIGLIQTGSFVEVQQSLAIFALVKPADSATEIGICDRRIEIDRVAERIDRFVVAIKHAVGDAELHVLRRIGPLRGLDRSLVGFDRFVVFTGIGQRLALLEIGLAWSGIRFARLEIVRQVAWRGFQRIGCVGRNCRRHNRRNGRGTVGSARDGRQIAWAGLLIVVAEWIAAGARLGCRYEARRGSRRG